MSLRLFMALISSTLILALSGCGSGPVNALLHPLPQSTVQPPDRLRFDGPDDQIRLARAGRFVIQASSRQQPQLVRGGQGRFEWLSITSTNATDGRGERQIMTWQGPLGRTLGSLERRTGPSSGVGLFGLGAEIRAFDAEGLMLNVAEQQRMLFALLGSEAAQFNEADISETLTLLMISMEQISRSAERHREFRFRIHQTDIVLLAVLDPA